LQPSLIRYRLSPEDLEAILSKKRDELSRSKRRDPVLDKAQIRELKASHQKTLQKQKETEQFKNALGIKGDYREGSAFDKELQGIIHHLIICAYDFKKSVKRKPMRSDSEKH
jgi:hypothetical protein